MDDQRREGRSQSLARYLRIALRMLVSTRHVLSDILDFSWLLSDKKADDSQLALKETGKLARLWVSASRQAACLRSSSSGAFSALLVMTIISA